MNTLVTLLISTTLLISCSSQSRLQNLGLKPPMEWGKIQKADLEINSIPTDSNASAIILYNYGTVHIEDDFKVVFKKHKRIKILNEGGYDLATVHIPFRKKASEKKMIQEIEDIEAHTFYLSEDGSIQKINVDNESIFEVDTDGEWFQKQFTFPRVKPGVIIEYKYKKILNVPTYLPTWDFQEAEPTLWSEYIVQIPGALEYLFLYQGYHPFFIRDSIPFEQSITLEYDHNVGLGGTRKKRFSLFSNGLSHRFVMKNIPALRDEPFITTLEDYKSKIYFQLSKYIFPDEDHMVVFGSWDDINEKLLKHENFGAQIQKYPQLRNHAKQIINDTVNSKKKMELIYNHICSSIKWNGSYQYIADKSLNEVYETKIGNSAEIALLLTSMLRDVGINAFPVITSTRDHGKIYKESQVLGQFNHVITYVELKHGDFLLDATDPLRSIDLLSVSVLNKIGRIIDKNKSKWIELKSPKKEIQNSQMTIKLFADGSIDGYLSTTCEEYGALFARKALQKNKNSESVVRDLLNIHDEIEINSLNIGNDDSVDKPLLIKCKINSSSVMSTL